MRSRSADTVGEAKEFANRLRPSLERVERQLRARTFRFRPQKGVLIEKKGKKSKRPIVIAPIETRIVQRALLDVAQDIPAVWSQLTAGHNFGGVPGDQFGVPRAVVRVHSSIQDKSYFIRTDVKAFFVHVPRERAIRCVLDHVADPDFEKLFIDATTTEIDDAERYGPEIGLFPIHDEGVAQGSCLSPLLCNLLLAEFDERMNGRGIVMVRYIDDFLILARDQWAACGIR